MRCDELRSVVDEGAPLDEAARAHLAECAACGGDFAALRALTSLRPSAPESLKDRVLAGFPARAPRWPGLARAAAVLLAGLGIGFVSGYAAMPPRVVKETVTVTVDRPVPDDYVSNVAIAADDIYGPGRMGERHLVEVKFVEGTVRIQSILVDPKMRAIEKYCPVARQLGSLAQKRPDVVAYKKSEY